MKRFLALGLLAAVLLCSCERPATRTNWSPINQSATELPATLAGTITPGAKETQSPASSTQQPAQLIGRLELNALPGQLPASMKGYELYSWQTGEDWNFTLITGTNRTKSFDEIITPGNSVSSDGFVKISVNGVNDLEKVLKLLPEGQSIFWGGWELVAEMAPGTVYLTFPPQGIMDEVAAICTRLHLTLTSLKAQ